MASGSSFPSTDKLSKQKQLVNDVMASLNSFKLPEISSNHPANSDSNSSIQINSPVSDSGISHSRSEPLDTVSLGGDKDSSFEFLEPITSSYNDQWRLLFSPDHIDSLLTSLKELGLRGQLRNCHFRSICWRLYLGVLSPDPSNWADECTAWRNRYSELKSKYLIDPRQYPVSDDPLSQSDDNPWHKYFKGESDRRQIGQDVMRTFPELKFFHDSEIQELLVRILYCYSQDSSLGYKQGMHEVLAPLVFVLHSDQLDMSQASEQPSANKEVHQSAREMLNPIYLEHDAYSMFSQIMEVISIWYQTRETSLAPIAPRVITEPFQNPVTFERDSQPNNYAVNHLNRLNENLLKQHDLELYMHLERLEIAPQMYGLRWLRLLFGREFPLQDLLVLWDALFSVGSNFVLTDYLYVAMLMEVRDLLLRGDFAKCLCLMMRYPSGVDVTLVIRNALYLYHPLRYAKPRLGSSLQQHGLVPTKGLGNSTGGTTTKREQRIARNKTVTGLETVNFSKLNITNKLPSFNKSVNASENSPCNNSVSLEVNVPQVRELTPISPISKRTTKSTGVFPFNASASTPVGQCDNLDCQTQREMCTHCAIVLRQSCQQITSFLRDFENVDTSATNLSTGPSSDQLSQLQLALAGVKQTLYMLNGNLSFNPESPNSTNDIAQNLYPVSNNSSVTVNDEPSCSTDNDLLK